MFTIRRMGCDDGHYSNFVINRPQGYDCRLILYIKTIPFIIHPIPPRIVQLLPRNIKFVYCLSATIP